MLHLRKKVVIVGGGFAGIELIKRLKKQPVDVFLVDKHNYHTFQPLLYQVATAGLQPNAIGIAFREIFKKQKNFHFRMAEVYSVNPESKILNTSIGLIDWDYLVIATGSKTNYFGLKDLEEHALPMKSIPQAIDLRNRLLGCLEKAISEPNPIRRKILIDTVIIGGGPTGVELAGALGEFKKMIVPRNYPELNRAEWDIYLVEMAGRLLPGMSQASSKAAMHALREFEVRIRVKTRVKSYDGERLEFTDGSHLYSQNVLWTAGTQGAFLEGLPEESNIKGRIKVNAFNQIDQIPSIFVLGDAAFQDHENPKGYPMLAPVAIQQAKHLASNLKKLKRKKKLRPFHYRSKGVMATIGRNHAVADFGKMHLKGSPAWMLWLLIHLLSLIGFRNKTMTLLNWIWSYFAFNSGLQLIFEPDAPKKSGRAEETKYIYSDSR